MPPTTTEERVKEKQLFRRILDTVDFCVRKEGNRKVLSFSASSETPVERWYGKEVLSHDEGAVKLDRARQGAMPLLFNHNIDDPIGMISAARVQNKRLMVEATLFDTVRANEVMAMIDGGLRNVSLAYRTYTIEEDKKTETYTVTEFEPYEVSIVTVPADPTVGVGRGAETEYEVRMVRTSPPAVTAATREGAMEPAVAVVPPAVNPAGPVQVQVESNANRNAEAIEAGRIVAINNLCDMNHFDDQLRRHWIGSGLNLDEISKDMVKVMKQRTEANPQSVAALGLSPRETQRYSILRGIRAIVNQNFNEAQFELECHRTLANKLNRAVETKTLLIPFDVLQRKIDTSGIHRRDLTVATASAGGYLVGTDNVGFIDLLRNRSVASRLGATYLSGLVGNVTIPRQSAGETAVWLANEASTITESAATFEQVALSPKSVGGYTEISHQLLLQSSPSAEGVATMGLVKTVATASDKAVLAGTAAGGQPQGIIGTTGVGSVTGTSLAAAGVLEFLTDVAAANVTPERPGYATTAAVAGLLMVRPELPTTGTTRLWTGNPWDGALFGIPAMSSPQMASATMLFGDWAEVIIAEWGVLEIAVNPFAGFQAAIVGVRAIYSMDVGVRHPAAFSYASSIT